MRSVVHPSDLLGLMRLGGATAFAVAVGVAAVSLACRSNPSPEVSVTPVTTVVIAAATPDGATDATALPSATQTPAARATPDSVEATVAPTVAARRAPVPTYPVLPIEQLAPSVPGLIDASGGPIAVAVLVPSRGVIYAGGEGRAFALASTVKVPIMLAAIERAASEGRALSPEERALVSTMIRYSDNVAASALWRLLGRAEGIPSLIARLGAFDVAWDDGSEWGDTATSAVELARLLEPLLETDAATGGDYGLALALMQDVAADQRWGVSAGLDTSSGDVHVALKDGWYPDSDGWRVASAGIVLTATDAPYSIVLLTDAQPTLEAGAWDLERIASAIHRALLPPELISPLVLTQFDGTGGVPAVVAASGTPATPAGGSAAPAPSASTPKPSFRQLAEAPGVLVPANGVLVSKASNGGTSTFWYEVPDANSRALLDVYSAEMASRGWTAAEAGTGRLLQSRGGFVLANAHAYGNASLLNIVIGPTAASVLASTSQ